MYFSEYMNEWLYGENVQAGKAERNGWLIEVGAHQGYLLCDMIQWLYTCDPALVKTMRFGIVERQPAVREAQLKYIEERFGNIEERFGNDVQVSHFADLSEVNAKYAFVVANEIFDAFPCELYTKHLPGRWRRGSKNATL